MKFTDKIAVVTGAGRGIGKGIAKRLLQEGAKVTIAEIEKEAGEEALRELQSIGEAIFIPTDITSEDSVRQMVAETVNHFGGLDYLVNNAAIADPGNGPIEELSLERWNRVITTNLTGTFLCSKYAAPYLKKSKGAIINLASTRALMSEPNTEAYSASKGGIVALTHALALSLGPLVRVNCISPGWIAADQNELTRIDHEQHPGGRVGRPEDIAGLVAYLLSEEASFITGANIVADGGMTRKMIYFQEGFDS